MSDSHPLLVLLNEALPNLHLRYEAYSLVAVPLSTGGPSQLLGQLKRRINQSEYLLQKVAELNSSIQRKAERVGELFYSGRMDKAIAMFSNSHDPMEQDQVILYTETFYWVAARTIKLITDPGRDGVALLPGSFGRVKCPGVTDVRNHIMEHPQIIEEQFLFDSQSGPKFNGAASDGKKEFRDNGLYINATQWANAMCVALDKATESLSTK